MEQGKNEQGIHNIVKGLLYKLVKSKNTGIEKQLLVVPAAYISKVLKFAHDSVLAGHQGKNRTLDKIKRNFFWPKMNRDVNFYIKSCNECQLTSRQLKSDRAPLQPIPICVNPYEELVIDFFGPMG